MAKVHVKKPRAKKPVKKTAHIRKVRVKKARTKTRH